MSNHSSNQSIPVALPHHDDDAVWYSKKSENPANARGGFDGNANNNDQASVNKDVGTDDFETNVKKGSETNADGGFEGKAANRNEADSCGNAVGNEMTKNGLGGKNEAESCGNAVWNETTKNGMDGKNDNKADYCGNFIGNETNGNGLDGKNEAESCGNSFKTNDNGLDAKNEVESCGNSFKTNDNGLDGKNDNDADSCGSFIKTNKNGLDGKNDNGAESCESSIKTNDNELDGKVDNEADLCGNSIGNETIKNGLDGKNENEANIERGFNKKLKNENEANADESLDGKARDASAEWSYDGNEANGFGSFGTSLVGIQSHNYSVSPSGIQCRVLPSVMGFEANLFKGNGADGTVVQPSALDDRVPRVIRNVNNATDINDPADLTQLMVDPGVKSANAEVADSNDIIVGGLPSNENPRSNDIALADSSVFVENRPDDDGDTAGDDATTDDDIPPPAGLSFFEKYLSIWAILCMVIGSLIGYYAPATANALNSFNVDQVNIPIAALVWLMILPALIQIDFKAILRVKDHPLALVITTSINYLIQPFTMFGLAVLFFRVVFANEIQPPALQDQFIAGAVFLGCGPCTAMVIVWSFLVNGDPAYTLIQIAINDVILCFAYAPTVGLLIGVANLTPPWLTIVLSTVFYLVIPSIVALILRRIILWRWGKRGLRKLLKIATPLTEVSLLLMLILIFIFQGQRIPSNIVRIFLICVPLLLQTFLMFAFTYYVMYLACIDYIYAAPGALIGTSNFFELAVALAIMIYGPESGAALVTVVGALTEVPSMLFLVWFCKKTRPYYERKVAERLSRRKARVGDDDDDGTLSTAKVDAKDEISPNSSMEQLDNQLLNDEENPPRT